MGVGVCRRQENKKKRKERKKLELHRWSRYTRLKLQTKKSDTSSQTCRHATLIVLKHPLDASSGAPPTSDSNTELKHTRVLTQPLVVDHSFALHTYNGPPHHQGPLLCRFSSCLRHVLVSESCDSPYSTIGRQRV